MVKPTGLLFSDSFFHYTVANGQGAKWTTSAGTMITPGRSGSGNALNLMGVGTPLQLTLFGFVYPTLCIEMGYQTTSFSGTIFQISNVAQGGMSNVGLYQVGDGRLRVGDPNGINVIISGFTMGLSTWYFVGLYLSMVGVNSWNLEVRISNNPIYSYLTSGSLAIPTGASGSQFGIASLVVGGIICDFSVTDGEFLGDTSWSCIFPDAVGDNSDWTPSPVQANYLNVQEHVPDLLTTTNKAGATTNQDLYNLDDIGAGLKIVGLHGLNYGIKDLAGVSSFKGSVKTNTTLVQEDEFFPSQGSWLYQKKGYRKNPVTGLDWTVAEVNAIQRGALRIT